MQKRCTCVLLVFEAAKWKEHSRRLLRDCRWTVSFFVQAHIWKIAAMQHAGRTASREVSFPARSVFLTPAAKQKIPQQHKSYNRQEGTKSLRYHTCKQHSHPKTKKGIPDQPLHPSPHKKNCIYFSICSPFLLLYNILFFFYGI